MLPHSDLPRHVAKFCSLLQVSVETLFGNVPSLIRAHQSFWEEVLKPALEKTRASGLPLDPVSMQDGFLAVRHGKGWARQACESRGPCLQGVSVQLESFRGFRGSKGTAPTPKYHLTACPSLNKYDLCSRGSWGFWRPL